jgi:hypothetical protein
LSKQVNLNSTALLHSDEISSYSSAAADNFEQINNQQNLDILREWNRLIKIWNLREELSKEK